MNRRLFLKATTLSASALLSQSLFANNFITKNTMSKNTINHSLQLSFAPYTLQLRHAFGVAGNTRTTTPVVIVRLQHDGFVGYGEASMPPYLGESHQTVMRFLQKLNLQQFNDPFLIDDILSYTQNVEAGNYAAKAAIDIALHDLTAKILNQPLHRIWGYNPQNTPETSFTIGIDTLDIMQMKVREAAPYRLLKIKIGRNNDREIITAIRQTTQVKLCVDVNQGWSDKQKALDDIFWLKEQGVVFIEQPFNKTNIDDTAWLTAHSPLPIIADEAFQNIADLMRYKDVYSGINIKLMKCGGLSNARQILHTARAFNMKVMVGCMTETSCAVTAAAQLSPMVDWADLDGNLLINNDLFDGLKINDGKVTLNKHAGIGVKPLNELNNLQFLKH